MNSYQLQEMIKQVRTAMRCPSCGSRYDTDNIHFLGQLDMAALVQLDCQSCGLPVMATILWSEKNPQHGHSKLMSDLSVDESESTATGEPVTTDSVVDVHQFLKKFDGNFETLFG